MVRSDNENKNKQDNVVPMKSGYKRIFQNKKLKYFGLFLLVFVSASVILAWRYFPARTYKAGIVAPRDILAPRDFEVENEAATRQAQSLAMSKVKPVYEVDPIVLSQMDADLKRQFLLFSQLHYASKSGSPIEVKELKSQLPISISDASLHTFVKADRKTLEQLEIITRNIARQAMQEIIKEDDTEGLKQARQEVRKNATTFSLPSAQQEAVAELVSESIRPNARIDWAETSRLRQERKDSVKPVMTKIKKGQVIVGKGQIITPEHIRILDQMGIQRSRIKMPGLTAIVIFNLIAILIMWYYIRKSMPDLAEDPKTLLMLIIIMVGVLLISSFLVKINPYLAPVPIASILISILINPRIALMATAILALCIGIMTGEMQYSAVSLITGLASMLAAWNVRRRLDLITTSVLVFLLNSISAAAFSLLYGDSTRTLIENMIYGGSNGFFSGITAIGLLPLLEHSFNITTGIKLLELSNQSEPLMKQLLMEAPGTYHHSIIVGNLAETGAELVGENPLLCRVGAYYHDIGKIRRPYFFIENQLGSENPHDKLSPNLSALIIISHVKNGIELGKKHNLPKPLMDIIAQHHGTNLISYFFHRARQTDKNSLQEEDFRYPGPKPQSKAAAIVMLADAVEAAARSIQDPDPDKIENLVQSVVRKMLDDGQLDECPLSMKNINDLIKTFSKVITGIYHQRIEYPDQIMEQVEETDTFQSTKVTSINRKAR